MTNSDISLQGLFCKVANFIYLILQEPTCQELTACVETEAIIKEWTGPIRSVAKW